MTSEERREARYRRRKEKRRQKALAVTGKPFEDVINFPNLIDAGKGCCNGSRWKTSTILFEADLLHQAAEINRTLRSGKRKFAGFNSFTTIEHGKARAIDALPIRERAGQKCLTKYYLTGAYSRSFIYDNSASLKGRGMDFALRRLRQHLTEHWRKYGTAGGIYQFDFKSYFGSIPHSKIKERARSLMPDDRIYSLFCSYVDDFRRMKTADPEADEPRGVGLGSEVSQIIALDAANQVDHFVKDRMRVRGYGRYMDDGYAISNSLDELRQIDREIHRIAADLGLRLNDSKCIITPFRHHSFRFLKMRFSLQENGRVVMKLSRSSVRAIRRKLYIFRRWVTDGTMGPEDAFQSYQSWRAHARRCDSYRTLEAMDERFTKLFQKELAARKLPFPCTLRAIHTPSGWQYRRNSDRKE